MGRERGEDAVGELPEPHPRYLVVDDLGPEWLAAKPDIRVRAGAVEPRGVLGGAGFRGDDEATNLAHVR
jgi:hypothetical protein